MAIIGNRNGMAFAFKGPLHMCGEASLIFDDQDVHELLG
jgi:hypothetical protein